MKVVHVPFCYYPDPVGGTEVYVAGLAKEQARRGVDAMIVAPGEREEAYWHDGIRVRRIVPSGQVNDVGELYGEGDNDAAQSFGRVLDEEQPDVAHLHAFTRGVSLRTVREAKRRGVRVVFSYHTPTVSCARGTLLRWGSEICDGVLDLQTCTECALSGKGLNRAASRIAGLIPAEIGRQLGRAGLSGGIWTGLRMSELIEARQRAFRNLMAEADHVIALCQWVKDLLLRNQIPEQKITVSRQGIARASTSGRAGGERKDGQPLSVAFLGRLDPTKGAHVLIQALKVDSKLRVRLDLYGIAQGQSGADHLRYLKTLAAGDPRVNFLEPLLAGDVTNRMAQYDMVAVPSQWLETGPLVVLEAFAAGVPVIGSDLGGIAELVTNGVDGLLVEPASVEAWSHAIAKVCKDPGVLPRLRLGVRPPREMSAVADDMRTIYSRLIPTKNSQPAITSAIGK